jgi:hypothetical protein
MGRQPIVRTFPIGRESQSEGTAIVQIRPTRRSSLLQFRLAAVPASNRLVVGGALRAA